MVMLDEDEEGTNLPIPTPIEPSEKPAKAARIPSDDGGVTPSLAPSPQSTSPDFAARQSLSRQTTLTTTASFSSLSSEDIAGAQNNVKLSRILSVVQEIVSDCRICWVSRTISAPHFTFRCSTRTCSGEDWIKFKSSIRFPPGKVCFYCFAPYSAPFNHAQAPTSRRQSPDQCDYPDVLKELTYIIYQDVSLRQRVFAKLGHSMPSNLNEYKRFITKESEGIFGVYEVIFAYIDVREEGIVG
jgi:hypothetical protein